MMSYFEIPDINRQDVIKALGFSQEEFYSLPYHYQMYLVTNSFVVKTIQKNNREELIKKMASEQFNLEEKSKKKVLSIFKK